MTQYIDSTTYAKQAEVIIGQLRVIQKAKRCGKENCAQCPHAGYWYLIMGSDQTMNAKREEVYLGKAWDEEAFLSRTAALQPRVRGLVERVCRESLTARKRDALLTEIEKLSELAAEHLTERDHLLQQIAADAQRRTAQVENEYRRESSAVQKQIKDAQAQLAKLQEKAR